MEELERKRRFLINLTYAVAVGIVYYVLVRYVLYALMPFTIALLVTFLLKRPVDATSRLLHIPRRGIAAFWVILSGTVADLINQKIDPRLKLGGRA